MTLSLSLSTRFTGRRPMVWFRRFRPSRTTGLVMVSLASALVAACPAFTNDDLPLESIAMPAGFEISLYATDVEDARSMALGDDGTLFVGTRRAGNVYALRDTDGDHVVDRKWVIAKDLDMPNGLAFRDGSLWVAEVHRILRFDEIERSLDDPGEPTVLRDDLPTNRHHGWKYIAFGPDGKLYVPVGAPCNVCQEEDPFASLLRMNPDGSEQEVLARGIRNTVGFDWHPDTGELWFSENGRDMMGDDIPPDELNRIQKPGQHFGFPECHGKDIPDPEFGDGQACAGKTPPALPLGPHVAALATRFYTANQFPQSYKGTLFIAEHGSWNRSSKIGYRIMQVDVDANGQASNYRVFAKGWLDGEKSWGRPVDLAFLPDGSMLVSDDKANAIYRIHYSSSEGAGQ